MRRSSYLLALILTLSELAAAADNPAPNITSVGPDAYVYSPQFTLHINGTGFIPASVVRWNGADRATTYVNNTKVTIQVMPSDLTVAGSALLTVYNPPPGGGTSDRQYPIYNPQPYISGFSPNYAYAGGPGYTLTVTGTGFVPTSVFQLGPTAKPTTFINSTKLTAEISASDIASPDNWPWVFVTNPPPGGGGANFGQLPIYNPPPSVSSISPTGTDAFGPGLALTVSGSGFVSTSEVRWNGTPLATTYVSSTHLSAAITASHLTAGGVALVTVRNTNSRPGDAAISTAASFTVVNPTPSISSLSPPNIMAKGSGLSLTVSGIHFASGAIVRWNGSNRPTTGDTASLTATISAADIASPGTAQVTVFNPSPGGGLSGSLPFTIDPYVYPMPSLSSLSPDSANAGSAGFNVALQGTGFTPESVVRWNGSDRTTQRLSAVQLRAVISTADLASAGTAQVTVFNPEPGGGSSNAVPFTIGSGSNPLPVISSLSPPNLLFGTGGQITVNGSNFVAGALVKWNGLDRATTFISNSALSFEVASGDIPGWEAPRQVTVLNPPPGGGSSNIATLALSAPIPTISRVSPAEALAGSESQTIDISGTGFVSGGSKVSWSAGPGLETTVMSPSSLRAVLPAALIASAGIRQLNVVNPEGKNSTFATFHIRNPLPTLTTISPSRALPGISALRLTATGVGFCLASKIRWNGIALDTVFISNTRIEASVPPHLMIGTQAQVTVFNPTVVQAPTPDGGASNAVAFTFIPANPVPAAALLSPSTANAGGLGLTLEVVGGNFAFDAVVRWNGSDRSTTFVSDSRLQAQISAADLSLPGVAQVTVFNPSPGGGVSIPRPFTINAAPGGPQISSGGIVNNASYLLASSGVARGSIAAIFGSNLTDGSSCVPPGCAPTFGSNGVLNKTMAGAEVTVGGIQAPIFYATPGQLGIQIPEEVSTTTAAVQVRVGPTSSTVTEVLIGPMAPGIFTFSADGRGMAAVTHADGSACTVDSPAHHGEAVILYATGLGAVAPPVSTGMLPTSASAALGSITVVIDGITVVPDFGGRSGCCVGLDQINFRVPASAASGLVTIRVTAGGHESNVVLLPVE